MLAIPWDDEQWEGEVEGEVSWAEVDVTAVFGAAFTSGSQVSAHN